MNAVFLLALVLVSLLFLVSRAYADGLASETLAPEDIQNVNVTLSVGTLPISTENNTGTQLNVILMDAKTLHPIPYATLAISALKGQNVVFDHTFQSDSGNFVLLFHPQDSGVTTYNETGNVPGNFSDQNSGYYEIRGPVFNSGGLYRFKIDVLTMNSYGNKVYGSYGAGISIPEYDNLTINDPNYGTNRVQIVAYYDQLHDIRYDQAKKSINFSMPFDWSAQNIKQLTVVHQEIRIPRTLGDFVVTKYDAYVNNIKIPDKLISIDDYSMDAYRIVHLILFRQDVSSLYSQQENPGSQMDFSIMPSNDTAFPVVHFTRNAQYEIALSWNPPTIAEGSSAQFNFKAIDPYRPNSTMNPIPYGFAVFNDTNGAIFHLHGNISSLESKVNVLFPPSYAGPITISFENLGGNTFANAEFSTTVVRPSAIQEFPLAATVLGAVFVLMISAQTISKKLPQKF
ncbi:MAG: hypothetical protein KGI27_02295 [Thaumarchaeota archaeon]|nr:hypothetical protein [Nitrososphaerota archaeon]